MKTIKGYESIVRMTQSQLKAALITELYKYYGNIMSQDGFLYVKGSRIMLTAHMDTVHKHPVSKIVSRYEDGCTILSSPQGLGGDDRNGVWAIVQILRTTDFRPTILFCEDEEIGSVGAEKFVKSKYASDLKDLLYIIELDRRGSEDAVFYDCGNEDFEKYICKITKNQKETGSFSDICVLSPAGDVASVNLSCGYYKEHHPETYTVIQEMNAMIKKVKRLLKDEHNLKEKFDYQEIKYSYFSNSYLTGYNYGYGYGDYDDDFFLREQNYVIIYRTSETSPTTEEYEIEALSEVEAIGYFLMDFPSLTYNNVEWCGTDDDFWNKEVSCYV